MAVRAFSLRPLFENVVFLSSLTSWILAQIIKVLVVLFRRRRKSLRELAAIIIWRTGGMPSSHAATVASLTVAVGISEGIGSTLFIVCFFFSLIVIRDAMGVRRSSGLQARALNLLGKNTGERLGFDYHPVKEIQGHSPLEVIVGSLLGAFIAAAYAWL
ncbi:MAG: divergent PAP2 family protein [Treponema sp.]|nr:divergent PAP2 family protein [Treponema sp.]